MKILDVNNPINWNNSLNFGLVSWLLSFTNGKTGYGTNNWKNLIKNFNPVLTNGPVWKSNNNKRGGFGNLSFDGVDDNATFDTSLANFMLQLPNFTISIWFNTNSFGSGFNNATLFSNGSGVYGPYISVGGNFANWYDGAWLTGNITLLKNVWTNITIVNHGVSSRSIYVNGLKDVSDNSGGPFVSYISMLGARVDGLSGGSFSGLIDDFKIWNRALSPSEISGNIYASYRGYPNQLNWKSNIKYFTNPIIIPTYSGRVKLYSTAIKRIVRVQ